MKLQDIASNNDGWASVFFVRRLAARRKQNPKELNAWFFARRDLYRRAAKARIDGGDRKLDRVTERFRNHLCRWLRGDLVEGSHVV